MLTDEIAAAIELAISVNIETDVRANQMTRDELKTLAQVALTALIEHVGGDGVTKADREAAARLNGYANWSVWQAAPQHDAEWMELCAHDFARHRATAFAAGKAARDREIVEWLRADADTLEREDTAWNAA